MHANPLLESWNTGYGLPPFDLIKPEHFAPALSAAMDRHLAEVEAIAASDEPPTFSNTVAAFDRSGRDFSRITEVFSNLVASETSDALQAVERELSPVVAAHENRLHLHEGLFARVQSLYRNRHSLDLEPEEFRLLERVYLDFVRSGAELEGTDRKRYAEITEELAGLYTTFSQAVLGDEAEFALFLETDQDRDGLPEFVLDAAASVARDKGKTGYAINLSPSLVDPFLTYSSRRDLREKVWRAFKARGQTHPDRDTRPVARRIVQLRGELAGLLGYPTFADFALEDRMAGRSGAVADLLKTVWEPAKKRAAAEHAELQRIAKEAGFDGTVEAWDWDYWAEQVRKERYQLDDAELKPYFELDNMIGAMFDCARRLYGLTFHEKSDVPLYHPDARLFEVREDAGDKLIGIFISDNFARATKRGGAWMSAYRTQSRNRDGLHYPIIVNNNNFAKAGEGKPTLLSFDNVRTLFHEFGHGLHGLLSDVTFSRLAGTNVLRDFVELPSQINENWAFEPEVLKKHALHVKTGEPIRDELISRIRTAREFNQGFLTVAYTSCALVDMALHELSDTSDLDIAEFERTECARLGVPEAIGMRHRLPHFRHLFSDDGYAAGYYVYMWAEVLEADGFGAFEETGDVFDRATAKRFRDYVLSAGDTVDPAAAFRAFRGRDPRPEPMLQKRGLV